MDLEAVVLSDLHLGAPHSVLNLMRFDPSEVDGVTHGTAARDELCDSLADMLDGGTIRRLVLAGDVIDLSHGSFADGIAELDSLLTHVRDGVDVAEVVFIPGNHDRHWWTLQCEFDSLIRPLLDPALGAPETLYPRTTPTGGRRDVPVITTRLAAHADIPITVAYPDYEFMAGPRRVRCHHGHLLEDFWPIGYDLLESVEQDFTDLARSRDPDQAPTDEQRRVLGAAAREFAASLGFSLGRGAARTDALDPEILERVSAPFVNFDWLFLGQTGLLRREGAEFSTGRKLMEFLSDAALDQQPARDAFTGLGQLLGLALLDRVARRKTADGSFKPHSYSNNPVKTNVVDALLERVRSGLAGSDGDVTVQPIDAPSTSLQRGENVKAAAHGIRRHIRRFANPAPDVFVFGHTHRSGMAALALGNGGGQVQAFNPGAWVRSSRIRKPESCFLTVDDAGNVQMQQVAL